MAKQVMAGAQLCRRCGATLKHYAGGHLCPGCMLHAGLETDVEPLEEPSRPGRPLSLPHSFGDYKLLEVIACGGMGIVYRARQTSLNRIVAVKMLLAGEFARPNFRERFRSEAEAAAQLQHPNIVAIHEIGEEGGQPYFSMDYVEGRSLAQVTAEFPDRSAEFHRCACWVKTMAEAVHYAHQHGIIHRDLKPANVIIDANDQPRITDFGLAKRLDDSALAPHSALTLTGQVLGSPNYLPPEQAAGKAASVCSDVYSLGAILYHLLTGRPPFVADSLTTLLRQVVEAEPVLPRLLNPGISRDLETISLKCLEKEPHRRYQTAEELSEDLARFLDSRPIQARPVGAGGRTWKWCRRRPAVAGMATALGLTVVLGLAGVLWGFQRARQSARAELRQRERAEAEEYAGDMRLAQLALAQNNRALAVSLLDKYRPEGKSDVRYPISEMRKRESDKPNAKSEVDRRGWEWRYLWQFCRGDESFILHRYPREINALALSRDGKTLAVATWDEVALWDLASRRQLRQLPVGARPVLAFSPTENLLATGAWDVNGAPAVALYDAETGRITKTLAHEAPVRSLAFSPDGRLLATFDNRGTVRIVDWASGELMTNLVVSLPRYATAGAVAFSADGERLAIGEDYGRVQVLNRRSGSVIEPSTQLGTGVVALAFSPTSDLLAAGYGYGTGTIRMWDGRTGESHGQFTNHTSDAAALAFTSDGRLLFSASRDGTVRTWNFAEHAPQPVPLNSTGEALSALAVLADGKTLVTGGREGSVAVWDLTPAERGLDHAQFPVYPGFESFANLDARSFTPGKLDPRVVRRTGLAFSPDSRWLITTTNGGSLLLVDTTSLRVLKTLPQFGSSHWGVALSPDGQCLVTGDDVGTITIWDWPAGRVVRRLNVRFEWIGHLHFSRSGHYLVARIVLNDVTFQLRLWRTADWSEVPLTGSQFANLSTVDFSPDERRLAAGYMGGEVKVFDFPSGREEASCGAHRRPVIGVHFLPGAKVLVSTGFDGSVRFWDLAAGKELAVLRGHRGDLDMDALSPDGRRLITGGETSSDAVIIWDLAARRELLAFQGEGTFFFALSFSPDGNVLAATAMSGTVHLWRAPSWDEIHAIENQQFGPTTSNHSISRP